MSKRLASTTFGYLIPCTLALAGCSSSSPLTIQTYTSPSDQIAVNSHLISGDTEAMLLDGQLFSSDAQKVVDLVKASGKKLKTIFVTHAHPDHYAALDLIKQAFPDAAVVTSAEVLADFNKIAPGTFQGLKATLGPLIPDRLVTPSAATSDTFTVDGQEIKVVKLTGGESPVSAVLYIPSLGAAFAGDHLYGNTHLFIAECMTSAWQTNINGLRTINGAAVTKYYPGHGPAGGAELLDANIKYITDALPILGMATPPEVTIAALKAKFPTLGGAGLLPLSVPQYQANCNPPTQIVLPGASYYPESITATADGALFVSSVATGQVQKFAAGSVKGSDFVPGGGAIKGVTGVLADDAAASLWLCSIDPTFQSPATNALKRYGLSDGVLKATYTLSGGAANLCNDMTLDGQGNLYVADSYGKIHKILKGSAMATVWSSDALLAPAMMGGFGADGITFDGTSNLYVNNLSTGALIRFPIKADGAAGTPVAITVTPALQNPDGMRQIDANTLLVVEGVGRLTKVVISGNNATGTALQSGLDGPTAVVKIGGKYYVTEGQLGHLTGQIPGPPNMPFKVRIFPAL